MSRYSFLKIRFDDDREEDHLQTTRETDALDKDHTERIVQSCVLHEGNLSSSSTHESTYWRRTLLSPSRMKEDCHWTYSRNHKYVLKFELEIMKRKISDFVKIDTEVSKPIFFPSNEDSWVFLRYISWRDWIVFFFPFDFKEFASEEQARWTFFASCYDHRRWHIQS